MAVLTKVTEMLTAFQAFEEERGATGAMAVAMAQSHWSLTGSTGRCGLPLEDPDVYVNSVAIQEALQQRKMARLGTKGEVVSFGYFGSK
jgi:hypothetical protein